MLTLDDIFERLEAMGYNQAAIARRLDTSEANVSRWRKGVHQPTPDVIESLAELARLSPAAVAVVIMASRAGKSRKAWERAYGDLAKAGLAAAAAVAVLPDCILCKTTEGHRRRRQSLPRLSGRVNHHQPALKAWRRGALRHAWHLLRGYSVLSRESLIGASWPMLGLMPA